MRRISCRSLAASSAGKPQRISNLDTVLGDGGRTDSWHVHSGLNVRKRGILRSIFWGASVKRAEESAACCIRGGDFRLPDLSCGLTAPPGSRHIRSL